MTFHTNATDMLDQLIDKAHEKIYNPKSNRMIVINGPVYRKLLLEGYMHWREERLLIPPLHELPILRRYLSFISYHIWNIVSERSLLAVVNEKISLQSHFMSTIKIMLGA